MKTKIVLTLLCSILITTQAKAESENNFEVPLIDHQSIFKSYSFGYEDVKNHIYKKDKERKPDSPEQRISK